MQEYKSVYYAIEHRGCLIRDIEQARAQKKQARQDLKETKSDLSRSIAEEEYIDAALWLDDLEEELEECERYILEAVNAELRRKHGDKLN